MKDNKILTLGMLVAIEVSRKAVDSKDETAIVMSDAATLHGMTLAEFKDLPIAKAKKLIADSSWIYPILTDQSSSDVATFDKMEYKVQEVRNLSFGQFTNLEAVLKANKETPYAALPRILGILLNNEKEEQMYEAVYNQIQRDSLKWDAREVIPLINFTLLVGIANLENTLPYLEHRRQVMTCEILTKMINLEIALTVSTRSSGTITGGIRRFVTWPAILLTRLMQYLIIRQAKSFISSNIKS